MNHDRPIGYIAFCIGVFGGLQLLIVVLKAAFRTHASRHLRIALLLAGACSLGWGTLGLIDRRYYPQFSPHAHYVVHHYKDMLSGAALSILVLEFLSGEFVGAYRRYKQSQRSQCAPRPHKA